MRARAIKDLAQLKDEDLFREVAKGMTLCFENAQRLYLQSEELGKLKHSQGYHILRHTSIEEVAKFLILLDAIRCPRKNLANHLSKFNSHLARGLYAESCDIRAGDYKELMHYLNLKRHELYLDGPNDVDFIMRNEIFQGRESVIYVDYIEHEKNKHSWLDPDYWCRPIMDDWDMRIEPRVFKVVNALKTLGIANAPCLEILASIWRPISMHDGYTWMENRKEINNALNKLSENNLLTVPENFDFYILHDCWQFPLYSEALENPIKTKREDLEDKQRNWDPGYY